jgi:hypothetical protein
MSQAAEARSTVLPDRGWLRAARWARWLAWASLAWMTIEGIVGLASGFSAGSIALVGWALSSVVEGLASIIVIWRFTGSRTLSDTAEERAQKAVAVSFWLLAPYVGIEAIRDLLTRHRPETTVVGIALTVSSLLLMPALGVAKRRLGAHRRRRRAEPALRLPRGRGPGRPARQQPAGVVVVGRGCRPGRRHCRGQGGPRGLARRELLRRPRPGC